MSNGKYAHYLDNHVWDATLTASVDPMDTYDLDMLKSTNPAERVRWDVKTVTINLAFGSAVTANTLAIPVYNLAGSVLTLTNGAGLSQAVTLPTIPDNGIPLTAILSFASSTSNAWHLVIASNAVNVTLGGGLWLCTARTLDHNPRLGFHQIEEQQGPETTNAYGVDYVPFLGTQVREFSCEFPPKEAEVAALRSWFQDGRKRPTLYWPDPSVNDAYIGRWVTPFDVARNIPNYAPVQMRFRELSKGKPV